VRGVPIDAVRCRRLARDYERLLKRSGLHFVAFVNLKLAKAEAAFDLVRNIVWTGGACSRGTMPCAKPGHPSAVEYRT
jgi:hypothetical protein